MPGQRFRVCTISPEGYVHSRCFEEIARLLEASLRSLGHECDQSLNELSRSAQNILLGYHLFPPDAELPGISYILYQLEPLTAERVKRHERLFRGARAVWDYSARNAHLLRSEGIAATVTPVGCHESLAVLADQPAQFDVLFYGSLTPRRTAVLDALTRRGLRVRTLFGVYGQERDEAIAASKIVLNIQQVKGNPFELPRIAWLLNNRRFVLSEETSDVCPGVVTVPYEKLEAACVYFASNDSERSRLTEDEYRIFRDEFPMVSILESRLMELGSGRS